MVMFQRRSMSRAKRPSRSKAQAAARCIVAIGGGSLGRRETLAIDRHIVHLTRKKRPRALFIPTASDDAPRYCDVFKAVYGDDLGCRPGVLTLLPCRHTKRELAHKILSADLIYVGGGNTLKMMRLWRRLGVDALLHRAWKKGIVLSGLSAGAICWFTYGHSDSMRHYGKTDWNYVRVRGLGLIDATVCPHYRAEKRVTDFRQMMQRRGGVGIALDNNCALVVIGDMYRVIASRRRANAYRVRRQRGRIATDIIRPSDTPTPVASLLGAHLG
jgi:dipeptidase E